ncbi:MAG: tRNA (adenosine(37)-N6)-threonylcarbamoyltransferase complex dimerization subunit type 1 TsaB [Alphaproteobacteria bacterium]|nr:tRNA (adenosine(37)-N6)-threonylcarbamoyltransferase complex dimerization subunit type 1 TsaB [Alphaproteobacteria bacterium]
MILAVDTAGPVAGAALWAEGRAWSRQGRAPRGTEVLLGTWIEELCAASGHPLSELTGIGVVAGPGAFTGLRVGLATVAGLAMALDLPVWTDDALSPRALRAGLGGELVSMLDARKGRVYAARWSGGERVLPPADIAPEVALDGLSPGFRATGEGALVYAALVEERGGSVVPEADDPGVVELARRTAEGLARGEGVSALDLHPRYLRDADAVPRAARQPVR